jgi:hypothetical protein
MSTNVEGQNVSQNDTKPVLSDVPCSLHFVIINIAAFQATGQTDKRVVTIKLTAEQQNELRQKVNRIDNASFFDVMMSFD